MGESIKSGATLEVSVSFGRFENNSLSWEKWSSFSPNKYLEEVENISTPGSVAQKKAYFEAHYKRIAARKAEQLDENPMGTVIHIPDEPIGGNRLENSTDIDNKSTARNGIKSAEVVDNVTTFDEARDDDAGSVEEIEPEACTINLTRTPTSEVAIEDAAVAAVCRNLGVQEDEDELNSNAASTELSDARDPVLVKEAAPQKDSQDIAEEQTERKGQAEKAGIVKKENTKSNARNQAQKVNPTKKGRDLGGTRKNITPSASTSPQLSVPRSKPTSVSTPMAASRPLKKKVNETPLVKSKTTSVSKSKRATPTSLHMSLSLGVPNSSAPFATTRKSLIMEKMGDKDIVKRAFRTFQNHINEVSSAACEQKVSSSLTSQKGNEGIPRKEGEKTVNQRAQLGTRPKPGSFGKNATAGSHFFGLRSDERAEKRKELLKNLEAKSIAREAEDAKITAKTKEEKEAEIRKLRQSLNFKATPLPSFYQGQGKGGRRQ